MRIISGTARGRRLFAPRNHNIRPTSNRAREALFSIIRDSVKDSLVIDFFAGTGAFGVEALSRGAKGCIFVDSARQALETIHKNIGLLDTNLQSVTQIIKHDLSKSLPLNRLSELAPQGIDIFFADPPYSKGLGDQCLNFIDDSQLFHHGSIIIIEERVTETLIESTKNLVLYDKRNYGEAAFWFYQLKE